jgi:hypothetical protein
MTQKQQSSGAYRERKRERMTGNNDGASVGNDQTSGSPDRDFAALAASLAGPWHFTPHTTPSRLTPPLLGFSTRMHVFFSRDITQPGRTFPLSSPRKKQRSTSHERSISAQNPHLGIMPCPALPRHGTVLQHPHE